MRPEGWQLRQRLVVGGGWHCGPLTRFAVASPRLQRVSSAVAGVL